MLQIDWRLSQLFSLFLLFLPQRWQQKAILMCC
ncbi:Uncharacterised protein [Salmonella enterica subsp. enterica]|uniref:Uncharacterized protein n=1 Tax=Salmonella enterica I TaxID=59201 RepID=A0A379WK77_SALET|nr:Uncharacterised protein [Salmonella enterica subsp. enterica]